MDLPKISICCPTYNRNKFKLLILFNLKNIDYPHEKLEFCIDDDGTEPYFENKEEQDNFIKLISPIKLKYYYRPFKRTIGVKRNNLVKIATHKLIACMDTDDIYLPSWLKYSVEVMRKEKAGCVGSNQMIFLYPHHNWATHGIRCGAKRQIHEACLVFTKKHFNSMGGFKNTSQGEGSKMADFNEKNVALLDIDKCMVCICHNDNTINKDMFMKEDNTLDINLHPRLKSIIADTLGIDLKDEDHK